MTKKPPKGKSLAEVNPELAKEWHPTMNGELTPFDVSAGSNKKIWWQCDQGSDHIFERAPNQFKPNSGCPICSGRKVVQSNCLATTNQTLASEWHPTKNKPKTPYDIVAGSNKRVWWKCKEGEDHEWLSSPNNRSWKNSGCPICSGNITAKSNSLTALNPELAAQWHPTKNRGLSPTKVQVNSHKKVWWQCTVHLQHVWKTSVLNRNYNKTGCPFCSGNQVSPTNSLSSQYPELVKEWHPTKNGELIPSEFTSGSGQKVWWKCNQGSDHEWLASIVKRTSGRNCPICSGQKVVKSTSLASTHPLLLKEWSFEKNLISPHEISTGSNNKDIWWQCAKDKSHLWQTCPNERKRGRGCPFCAGRRIGDNNNLLSVYPDIAAEWNYSRNGYLNPENVTHGSGKIVWWKCPKGEDHEWQTSISNRVRKKVGCPICANYVIVESNSLGTRDPELSKQWHPNKNGALTPFNVGAGSDKKVWWKCPKGEDHEWPATIVNRYKGKGCPFCTLTPQSRQELTISFELALFFNINPKGFKTRRTGRLWTIDIYIQDLNLGIEFDGKYWHKDKRDLDKLKTKHLTDAGFHIMRIREEPLKAITDIDVISKIPFNAKHVANDILKHIMVAYTLEKEKIDLIELYLRKKTIQNEQGLEDYIEEILTEKAERKKNK